MKKRLEIQLSEDEYQWIKNSSNSDNLSMAAYVRYCVLIEAILAGYHEALRELTTNLPGHKVSKAFELFPTIKELRDKGVITYEG